MIIEDVDIQITLSSEWWRDPPFCEIHIDNKLIDRLYISSKRLNLEKRDVLFRGNLSKGPHFLTIRYLNKKDDDDQFDENGVGILSQHLYIENIIINKIKFDPSNGNNCCSMKIDKQRLPYTSNILTNNCEWTLKFSVPTYLWLMEHS